MIQPQSYIGQPYDAGSYNCWHFFRRFQAEVFGRDVGDHCIDVTDIRRLGDYVTQVARSPAWRRVDAPEHGCAVLMQRARQPLHLGCWLDTDGGGIIHNMSGFGVVFQTPAALTMHGWTVEGYYQPCV